MTAYTKIQRKNKFPEERCISMCVYMITNKVNGKKYIGITSGTAGKRWGVHIISSRKNDETKGCPLVVRAINKYGEQNFDFEVIDLAESREQLSHKEQFWIDHHGTLAPNGYNLTTGGDSGFMVTEETRKKQSVAAQNRTQEVRNALSEAKKKWYEDDPQRRITAAENARKHHTGRKHTKEMIEARCEGKRNMEITHEYLCNLARSHMKGKLICCSNGKKYLSSYEAAIDTGVDKNKIGNVCTGKRKSTGGFVFWYEVTQ